MTVTDRGRGAEASRRDVHILIDAWAAAVTSDYRGARVALSTGSTAGESSWADHEHGIVSVGVDEFGVDVWRAA